MKEIFSSPAKYGYKLKTKQLYQPIRYSEIKIDTTINNLAVFAQSKGVSYAQLKKPTRGFAPVSYQISPEKFTI